MCSSDPSVIVRTVSPRAPASDGRPPTPLIFDVVEPRRDRRLVAERTRSRASACRPGGLRRFRRCVRGGVQRVLKVAELSGRSQGTRRPRPRSRCRRSRGRARRARRPRSRERPHECSRGESWNNRSTTQAERKGGWPPCFLAENRRRALASGGSTRDHWPAWPRFHGPSIGWPAASRRPSTRRRRSSAPSRRSARGSAGGSARRGSRRRASRMCSFAWRPGARPVWTTPSSWPSLTISGSRPARAFRAGCGRPARRRGSPTSRTTRTSPAPRPRAAPACTPPSASRSGARAASSGVVEFYTGESRELDTELLEMHGHAGRPDRPGGGARAATPSTCASRARATRRCWRSRSTR